MVDDGPAFTDFDDFVTARGAGLVRVARGLLRDPQHAQDVVQDVLVNLHRHWDVVIASTAPEAYVRRALVNACTSFWRRAARRELAVADLSLLGASALRRPDSTTAVDDRDLMLRLLRRLPPRQRAALVLRHYEGLSDDEIAVAMGTTVMTVRSQIHRGVASLRIMLTDTGKESS